MSSIDGTKKKIDGRERKMECTLTDVEIDVEFFKRTWPELADKNKIVNNGD